MRTKIKGRFVGDATASTVTRRANDYARKFNAIAERHGIDLPMEVLIPLIELFGEALQSVEAGEQ